MFKKIEIWILYLVVLLGIPITIGFGSVVRHEIIGGTKLGRISETALFFAEIPANIKKIFFSKNPNEVLDRFPLLDSFNGTPNASESYLLLSRYDGDLKEGIVELVDLTNFKILHTWNPDINSFNKLISKIDEFKYMERDQNNSRQLLNHPKLIRDGDDVTIVATSLSTIESVKATDALASVGIKTDLFDLRVLNPLDTNPIVESFKKTGRLLTVDTGHKTHGIGGEIIAQVMEKAASDMKSPPSRIALPDHPVPSSRGFIPGLYPDSKKIVSEVCAMVGANSDTTSQAMETLSANIGNLPVGKWFHISIMLIGTSMDIYINGQLKKRCKFKGIPKLNYGDLYLTAQGGFDGYVSKLKYYNRSLQPYEIEQAFYSGPSSELPTGSVSDKPPYLASDYWMKTGFPNSTDPSGSN